MLTTAETRCLERIQVFADSQIAKAASGWSTGDIPNPALYRAAAELGLTSLEIPKAKGGAGFSFALKVQACEALAAADFGFAMSVINTQNVGLKLVQCADHEVLDTHLPALIDGRASACTALTEPGTGSDFANIRTRAVKVRDGWQISGQKCWIVNARYASLAIVYAQCADDGDRDGIGAFLVDLTSAGCRSYAIESGFSQTSCGTGGFEFDACHVPGTHMLIAPGAAFKSILHEINGARVYVAAMCCGMLSAALNCVVRYGAARTSFGRPLAAHQGWRLPIAQAEVDLAAAKALVQVAVDTISTGQEAQLVSAQAKVFATRICQSHMPALLHAMGAEGLRPIHPLTRHLAAAQMATLTDGSTEMLLERVARLARPAT